MSISDSHEVPMCHGFMVDFQPDLLPLRNNDEIPAEMIAENLWHLVRFGTYIHGWGEMVMPADHIYDIDGTPLAKEYRTLKKLSSSNNNEGFLVWWQYIQPRKIQMECKPKKRTKKTKKPRS